VLGSIGSIRYLIAAVVLLSLSLVCGGSETIPSDIQVELSNQKPLTLRVTLRSRAETRVTFRKYLLPWENRYSMILVAVTPHGDCLDRNFPIDDPSPERVTLEPNESLSGEIDLHKHFGGLSKALKKSEIHLYWAYDAPKELNIAHWSGGWILIPQQTGSVTPPAPPTK
jgi:hypothetical protein